MQHHTLRTGILCGIAFVLAVATFALMQSIALHDGVIWLLLVALFFGRPLERLLYVLMIRYCAAAIRELRASLDDDDANVLTQLLKKELFK